MKAEKHTNASFHYFFLNVNRTKNDLAHYSDFGRKISDSDIKYFFQFQLFDDEFSKFYPFILLVDANHFIQNAKRSIDIQVRRELTSK